MDAFATPLTEMGIGPALGLIPGYVLVPTGGRVFYVHSSGRQSGDPSGLANVLTTVNAAAALCRANRGDVIIVGPGHAENIGADAFGSLPAGVDIIGLGSDTNRPTFTMNATASQVKMDAANTRIANCRFTLSIDAVVLGFSVEAAGCGLFNCYIEASDGTNNMTKVMDVAATGDDFTCSKVQIYGGSVELPDTVTVAAADRVRFLDCDFSAVTDVGKGLLSLSGAAVDIRIDGCKFYNRKAAATVALKGHATATGFVDNCFLGVAAGTVIDSSGTLEMATIAAAFNTPGTLNVGKNMQVGLATGKYAVMPAVITATV